MPGGLNNPITVLRSPTYRDSYQYPYNPDPHCYSNDYSIYDEMRDDEQVKAAINMKKDLALNSGWQIMCDDEGIRDFLTDNLNELEQPLEDALREIMSAYEYGFSISEPVYELVSGQYRWKSLMVRPPHTFSFDVADDGRIKAILQDQNMRSGVPIPTNRLIHYIYQPEFGNPYGKSDLRAAHASWVTKKFIVRFMAIYLERFASPTVIGRYPTTAGDKEIERIHEVLRTIQNVTTLALPEGTTVDFLQPNRDASETYIKAINAMDMKIARAILVPDLMGMSGEKTGGGSYSLGQTQFEMFLGTIQKDRRVMERVINEKLIRPLVQANFGQKVSAKFEFMPVAKEDESKYAEIWARAVQGKTFTPNDDEVNHFRQVLKFPQGPVEIPEPAPLPEPGKPPFGDKGKEKPFALKMYRSLTTYEQKVDFANVTATMKGAEKEMLDAMRADGKSVWSDLIEQFRNLLSTAKYDPAKVNTIEARNLKPMNADLKRLFRRLFQTAFRQAKRSLEIPPEKRQYASYDDLEDGPWLPDEFMRIMDADAFKTVGDYATEMTKKMRARVFEGIKDGTSTSEIVKELKDMAPDISDVWLETVVRTKITDVYNRGARTYYESDPIARNAVVAYQFSAVMDDRTTECCQDLDQKIYEIGDYIDDVTPPLHFNCRSTLIPVTKYEDYEESKKIPLDDLKDSGAGLVR
jgi:SPP1 gp7 family putative phage head morphogenesis protein